MAAQLDLRHRPAVRRIYVAEAALEGLLLAASVGEWINASTIERDPG